MIIREISDFNLETGRNGLKSGVSSIIREIKLTALGRYWSVSIRLNNSVLRYLVEAACRVAMDTSHLKLELCHLHQAPEYQSSFSIGENFYNSENYYQY